MAVSILNGIGTRMSGLAELQDSVRIRKEWQERTKKSRRAPGTHTLGKAFQTVEVKKDG